MKLRSDFRTLLLAGLGFSLLFIASCGKEQSGNGTDEQQQVEASKVSSEADGEAEIIFNGIFDDAMGVNAEVGMGGTGIFGRDQACPDVLVTHLNAGAVFPIRIVLNFGVNGCIGRDGHLRRGKIIIEYTDRIIHPGAVATTTFDGFYFEDIKVEGVHKITNTMTTQQGNRSWKVDVIGAKLTRPNGNYTMWNSHKTIIQIEGAATMVLPMDDIFKIEGTSEGKVLRGNLLVLWNSNIVEPLIKKFNCRWIVKGKVRTVRSTTAATSPWVALLDFGAGNCDNQATITINGVLHQITLP